MANLDWYRQRGLGKPPLAAPVVPVFVPRLPQTNPEAETSYLQVPIGQQSITSSLPYWRGSRDAAAQETGNCPSCGSSNYFGSIESESSAGGRGGKARGHCMACSYREGGVGPTMQSRAPLRGLNGSVPTRQARQARQDSRSGGLFVVAHVS